MPTLELTPSVLRALGEGVERLRDGDDDDRSHADQVVDSMRAMRYRLGGYNFARCDRFSLSVNGTQYSTCEYEEELKDLMGTAWRSPDRQEPCRFEIWDYDEHCWREDLVKSKAPANYLRQ